MYNVGDWIYDSLKKEKVQIIEIIDLWGFISYKVFNPFLNEIYKVSEDCIDKIDKYEYDEFYVKYIIMLEKIKSETSQGLLSNLSNGIIPLPHQLHVLNRAVSNNNIRYILADEVGLGKTIEAGLIIKELKARGLAKRILVVCPTGLVTQWGIEMEEKFHEKFHIILPSDYETIKKITDNEDVYGQFEQVISTMDSIKPLDKRAGWSQEKIKKYNEDRIYSIINSGWDLIIIDEAHRVAGSSSEVARYRLGRLLGRSSPYLLLLTATPHSGKTEPFLRLIRLLDEKAFPNTQAIVKEQVAPYVIRTEKKEAIDNEGNKLFKNRITKTVEISWDERHSMQEKLYELVTNYVRNGYNKAMKEKKHYIGFLMVLMQRLVTSSTAAIKESIEKRIDILENQQAKIHSLSMEDLVEVDLEENLEQAIEVISLNLKQELLELKEILNVAKQAEFEYLDSKVEILIEILDNLYSQEKRKKVIIFTEFVSTQNFLKDYLLSKDYKVSILNGSMSIEERNEVLKEFKIETDILISTDAGGEGLNLQFSNVVINYDLPWNPMKIEQRIGRVDRIGQKQDVLIFNFVIKDTIENRVKNVLEDKLGVILSETGIDKMSDVLDNEMAELDFTDVYIKSIRTPKNIEHNVKMLENEIKQQIELSNKYKELIKEDKDLSKDIYNSTEFDLDSSLRKMLESYCKWKGDVNLPIKHLSINDEEIVKHLNRELEVNIGDMVPYISIKDIPNEEGYFMIWELTINDDKYFRRVIPIFINKSMVLRPLAGRKLWDILLKTSTNFEVVKNNKIDSDILSTLKDKSKEFAYDIFIDIKEKYEKNLIEKHNKYLYAIDLRIEAASKIGIKNIREARLKTLSREKKEEIDKYNINRSICPAFKSIFLAYLEM
ncbi:DEAD/DEAH box helicase [Clostridium neonatale]|uniref:DEAD/DEAH box helicase n=1 Tax=Clostridium neonatale TaxID=137838 RepID=UPI00291B8A28|nr:helicase-related protein [Clostridium neonatale]CAI3202755.1 ATP-dependent helicase HepA [Clostridium neonatale]CAI3214270.1 ATP-dependent helicase HepA [Clostridium neonatale]CAI3563178.1 ATP-dependent helicase HepA [Clostridium neonatale]